MDERDQESFVVAVGGSAESPRPEECGRWRGGQHTGLGQPSRKNAARLVFDINMGNSDIRVSQMFTAWDEWKAAMAEYRCHLSGTRLARQG